MQNKKKAQIYSTEQLKAVQNGIDHAHSSEYPSVSQISSYLLNVGLTDENIEFNTAIRDAAMAKLQEIKDRMEAANG